MTRKLKHALKKHIDILNNSGVCYPAKYDNIEKINKAISNLCEELNNTKILADKEVENITAAY